MEGVSVKDRIISLLHAIRLLLRSMYCAVVFGSVSVSCGCVVILQSIPTLGLSHGMAFQHKWID